MKILYKTGGADKSYKEKLYNEIVNPLCDKYGISNSYIKPLKEKIHKDSRSTTAQQRIQNI